MSEQGTIRNRLRRLLVDRGMFDADADKIIEQYLASEIGTAMKGRLDEPEDSYPPQLIAALLMGLRTTAVDWIDANCPTHWARPLFAEGRSQ